MGKSVMQIDKSFISHFLTVMPEGVLVSGAREVSEHTLDLDVSGALIPDSPRVTGIATATFEDDRTKHVSWRFEPSS